MPPTGARGSVYLNNHAVKRVGIDLDSNPDEDKAKVVLPPTENNLKKLEQPQRRTGNIQGSIMDSITSGFEAK